MSDELKLIGISTNDGYYISESHKQYSSNSRLAGYSFDGKAPQKTFKEYWFKLDAEPKKIERKVNQPDINHRYELIDESMISDKIKRAFIREEVADYEDYEWIWKDEYKQLQSLYRLVSEKQEPITESVPFTLNTVMHIDRLEEHDPFSYTVPAGQYHSDGKTQITENSMRNQIIDQIIFPDIMLPSRPCRLSSEQTYKVVREYVKDNIDPKAAEITSDYDFCFTVEKRILMAEPEKYTVDTNNSLFQKRKRKPKYVTRYKRDRKVKIFEMTYSPKGYDGYTPITGFQGNDQTDLKGKIDFYLESLIEFINMPVEECSLCRGDGVIVQGKFEINKR